MTQPVLSADAFRALARSSPWRWRTLHFRHRSDRGEVEAWVRRPGEMLVIDPGGTRHRVTDRPTAAYSSVLVAYSGGEEIDADAVLRQLQKDHEPTFRPDGLVATRSDPWTGDHDDPMWVNYQWVAMLDPYELSHGVDVHNLREDEVAGRPVWRADLRALQDYDPRCGCCELLWCEISWEAEWGDRPLPPDTAFPDHYDVALDVQTGVVVQCLPVDGRNASRLEVEIIEVDADLDALFNA